MSEYWKSTPRYWCKHCKTFVRDTSFERTQHEATAKHQSNLKRFLRELHRTREREERESQSAKDEVRRLGLLVAGPSNSGGEAPGLPSGRTPVLPSPAPRAASLEERRKQIAQLAEMGVAVPEECRREMALAGEWQVISEKAIAPRDKKDVEPSNLNIGVRKRKLEEQGEEQEEIGEKADRRGWFSVTRDYPNADRGEDLDVLLEKTKDIKRKEPAARTIMREIKSEETYVPIKHETDPLLPEPSQKPSIKKEESSEDDLAKASSKVKESEGTMPHVVFKKRKTKSPRK